MCNSLFWLMVVFCLGVSQNPAARQAEKGLTLPNVASSPNWYFLVRATYNPGILYPSSPTIHYMIRCINIGDASATNVVFADTLDALTEYQSSTGGIYDPSSRTVQWSLGTIEPQDLVAFLIIVGIKEGVPSGTVIVNTAFITCAEGVSKDTSLTNVVIPVPVPVINKMTLVRPTYPGLEMVYNIDYGNVGDTTATDVLITDYLPEKASFVSCTHDGALSLSGDRVLWTLGELQPIHPSDLADIQLTVRIDSTFRGTTIIVNNACIRWAELPDFDLCSETSDTFASPPELSLSIEGSDSYIQAGEEVLYRIRCENSGWSAAHYVVITAFTSDFTEYVTSSGDGQYDFTSRKVTWIANILESQQEKVVTLTVSVKSPLPSRTQIINRGSVTCSEGFSASDSETTVVLSTPAWNLFMVAKPPVVIRGQQVTFTTQVINVGNMNASNTIAVNPVSYHLTYLNNYGGGIYDADENTVIWDLGPINVDEEKIVSITVNVATDFPLDKKIVNQLYVQSDEKTDSISISLPLTLPQSFALFQNYPNPFNQGTTISYQLSEDVTVLLKVINILGQEVISLVNEHKLAGVYSVQWNGKDVYGRDVASGVYFYRNVAGDFIATKRMLLLK